MHEKQIAITYRFRGGIIPKKKGTFLL
ncbi:uncharacterized protein METZ01_LOCUS155158 [marine metagenome]|uniref:Uncharacterized protein n=1 Tax=marine metagenome TaxID=408172 RepID=A0A382ALN9_9ZZZZ